MGPGLHELPAMPLLQAARTQLPALWRSCALLMPCRSWEMMAPAPTPTSLQVGGWVQHQCVPRPAMSAQEQADPKGAPHPGSAGMNWVLQHVLKNGWRGVVNMSLGGESHG